MPAFSKIVVDGKEQSSSLELLSLHAYEQLGKVYQFNLSVLSNRADLGPRQLLGKNIGVQLMLANGMKRWFNGVILRIGRGAQQGLQHEYWLQVQPDLALLGYRSDARIFQNKSVTDVFGSVVAHIPTLSWQFRQASLQHRPWEYCVQYQETDLNFALRLLEQEGIYFWFDHLENGQTKMTLLDDNAISREASRPLVSLSYNPNAGDTEQEYLRTWTYEHALVPGRSSLGEFDFKRPMQAFDVNNAKQAGHPWDAMEIYHYPGEFDGIDEGRAYAEIRRQSIQARHAVLRGATASPQVRAGRIMRVKGHPVAEMNGEFLVVATDHNATAPQKEAGGGAGAALQCYFEAIPADVQYRPDRATPKGTVLGPQTAFVVGPEKNEIHTDEHGRIRVQFHWDRYGKPTEDTSCWIRVAQPWANQGFGFWALPRVGSEVVVQFLDGDPDRPIVTASVYNAENRIPYAQPANKTRSGIRTLSTPQGGVNDFNEFRFEDKKGEEEIYLQAQKNMNTRVKADATRVVGANDRLAVEDSQNIRIANDRSLTVGGKQSTSISDDHNIAVGRNQIERVDGDRMTQVGSDSLQVQGDLACSALGDIGLSAGQSYAVKAQGIALGAGTTFDLKAGLKIAIDAGVGLSLRCGSSFISLTPAGIFIQGTMVMLNSGGASLNASEARPAQAKSVQKAADAKSISVDQSPPVVPATQRPRAGALADAARTGSPIAAAG